MNRTIICALALIASTASVAGESRWQEAYIGALDSLAEGEFSTAAGLLAVAANEAPEPQLNAIDGQVDYLPHLNLAAARFELGEYEDARGALEQSASFGVARQSYVGRQLWDSYALRIVAAAVPEQAEAEADPVSFRDFERTDFVLAQGDAEAIRRQVLRRCALSGDDEKDILPWYFHYEFGRELLEAGDAQRALDELILAASKREESKRGKRMYGMWFTNYLPYYQIAQAHSQLGNWRCAMDAMRLSSTYGEFSPTDRGFDDYSDLQKLIMRQNDASGG
ncbi:MAG: hypothetical protein AAGE01_08470 [Pseudomonadota bacterium]